MRARTPGIAPRRARLGRGIHIPHPGVRKPSHDVDTGIMSTPARIRVFALLATIGLAAAAVLASPVNAQEPSCDGWRQLDEDSLAKVYTLSEPSTITACASGASPVATVDLVIDDFDLGGARIGTVSGTPIGGDRWSFPVSFNMASSPS